MAIRGIGSDVIEVSRIERLRDTYGERFFKRVYTKGEIAYCESKENPAEHLAGRFAAKEAVFKLIGTGWRGKIAWTDIEVVNDSLGRPEVVITGEVKKLVEQSGIEQITISITHTANFAICSAVALRNTDG